MGKTYTFRCPVCLKFFTWEHNYEPCCTGPSESRHDHEMTIMHLHKINRAEIDPMLGAKRADGPMIITENLR